MEAKLASAKSERDELSRELGQANEQLEEQGDTIYDLQSALKEAQAQALKEAEANAAAANAAADKASRALHQAR